MKYSFQSSDFCNHCPFFEKRDDNDNDDVYNLFTVIFADIFVAVTVRIYLQKSPKFFAFTIHLYSFIRYQPALYIVEQSSIYSKDYGTST